MPVADELLIEEQEFAVLVENENSPFLVVEMQGPSGPPGPSGGSENASYVVLANDPTLTNERVLTPTPNQVLITDNGPGNTVQLSLPQDIGPDSWPTFSNLSVTSLSEYGVVFVDPNPNNMLSTNG